MPEVVSRAGWGARPPDYRVIDSTWLGIAYHWGGPGFADWPWSHSSCLTKLRGWQNYHMDAKGWSDLAYNWVVCPHGVVFEGRGWNVRNGANGGAEANSAWHAACYLAGAGNPFTDAAKVGFQWLHTEAARQGHPATSTHRRVRPGGGTECPGDEIDAWVVAGLPVPASPPEEDDMPAGPATVTFDGAIYTFARSPRNELWYSIWDGDLATLPQVGWSNLGGNLTSAPSAAVISHGRLIVTVRGTDGAVWARIFDGVWNGWFNGVWSGWFKYGGDLG